MAMRGNKELEEYLSAASVGMTYQPSTKLECYVRSIASSLYVLAKCVADLDEVEEMYNLPPDYECKECGAVPCKHVPPREDK